ncbi:putative bifunctional diguanylate cyclase/phosphodiesterase [Kineococcus sp. DHX-1]|uniref:putative bifunctional diguanylate cyclase/phosphodiesterase n=1 Tax=Kineococcus sp. DHX-1 TaxID=3349638 RepID=UPI0036D40315
MNRNLGRALPAAFFVAGAGLAAQWTTRTADGRLVSAALLVVVLTGTFLLHRGAGLGHRGMSATTWRSFTVAGTVLVAGAVADLVLATVGRPGASQGLPLAIAALIAGPLVLRGVVRWNPDVQHVLEEGHGLITASAVLVLAGAGNLVLPWLPSEVAGWDPWRVQVWIVSLAVVGVLVGTCIVAARISGLAGDVRVPLLSGSLVGLGLADASAALTGDSGLVALHGAVAAGLLVTGAAAVEVRRPVTALVGAGVPAGGALFVLLVGGVVLLLAVRTDAAVAIGWAGLAVLGSAVCLVRQLGPLSQLAQARVEARTDELTGLGNRRALVAQADRLAAGGVPHALLKLDLDGFGLVNERLGHAGGDEVLRAVARTLRSSVPEGALTARTAGDTFAVLLPGAGEGEAVDTAHVLAGALPGLPTASGHRTRMTASTGVSVAEAGTGRTEDLLHRAAAALALARRERRRVAVFDAALEQSTRDRAALAADVAAALADPVRREAELVLAYQPQLEVGTGAVVGVEALVRWRHPHRGPLSPDRFLDLAEEHGLMDGLTAHLLDRAVRECASWTGDRGPLRVSVNLSASSLASPELLGVVDDVLRRHAFDPARLVLEITETTLMGDPDLAVEVTERLVARGVSLSIDDYGTGYSSLAYLNDLPASELKLDRAFTLRVTSDPRTAAIVEGTVALAHRLGLRVLAEGVEDLDTLAALRRLGVDESQGYLHARPLDPGALTAWLAGRAPELEHQPA